VSRNKKNVKKLSLQANITFGDYFCPMHSKQLYSLNGKNYPNCSEYSGDHFFLKKQKTKKWERKYSGRI